MFTSELADAELMRIVRRHNYTDQGVLVDADALAEELAYAAEILESVEQVVVDRGLMMRAGALEAPMLRTLDAIHLASAMVLGQQAVEFVTYDKKLAATAQDMGLRIAMPSA